MPFVVRSDSENENEVELVFLSPEEEPAPPPSTQDDQGASPVLRRSNRKRKSVAAYSDSDMSKGSGSKKKKGASPDQLRSMPKLPRTPQASERSPDRTPNNPQQGAPPAAPQAQKDIAAGIESYLSGMEARLASKLDANNKALNAVEEKVDSNDAALRVALKASEERMMTHFQVTVKGMVLDQLRAAGFDPDLTVGALTAPSTVNTTGRSQSQSLALSYATMAAEPPKTVEKDGRDLQLERREDRFWECRRSLRLWPVPEGNRDGLETFLKEKLRLDERFIREDLGQITIRRNKDLRAKNKDEVFVTFETKDIRDAVKAQAPNLANYRENAGMRLHLPNHLQKDFKALMGLSYDMKKKNPDLKRNVKFDEDDLGLFMDVQMRKDGPWRRIKPEQARRAIETSGSRRNGPDNMQADEIAGFLGGSSSSSGTDE